MNRYHVKTSTFFSKLANGLGMKQRPAIIPLSEFLGPPGPQTCHIFEFPDELILSVLSYLPPDPGRHAQFHFPHIMDTGYCYRQQRAFLLPLSMTCRAMWLRLLPWIWERVEMRSRDWVGRWVGRSNAIVCALHADPYLGVNVKFLTTYLPPDESTISLFVKCLESLPNLHTLEIPYPYASIGSPLKKALKGIKLPQIKTLVIPPAAHSLLRHCHGIEDLTYMGGDKSKFPSNTILGSLASNQDSKIKRLMFPLILLANPSRLVAACPKLTELSIVYPYLSGGDVDLKTETSYHLVEKVHSATLELAKACKTLPDFDTFQIVHFDLPRFDEISEYGRTYDPAILFHDLRDGLGTGKDLVISCLKEPETGRREGEGKKKTTVRVIELVEGFPPILSPGSAKVEVYEV